MNLLRLEASTSDLINWSSIKQERGLSYPRSWKVEFSLKHSSKKRRKMKRYIQ